MKRRTFLALGLTAALSIPFAMTAFADGSQYKAGQTVEFSGHTDFGYYYTYTAGSSKKVNFKCFCHIPRHITCVYFSQVMKYPVSLLYSF